MKKTIDETVEDDLRYGQKVIILARWMIVVFALLMGLYRPQGITELVIIMLALLAVAVLNFALHVRVLTDQPVKINLIYAASLVDICLISLITGLKGGINTHVFLYYYPAVLAFSLVFPRTVTIRLTIGVLILYLGVCLLFSSSKLQYGYETTLIVRLLSISGVAVVGNQYRLIQAKRRKKATEKKEILQEEIEQYGKTSKQKKMGVYT
jgi:ABC-type uncharacterized transport system permease subunit